ncbi:hypothetical protein KKC97_00410 [bacterium]|nr:hypothetical protein [bacterium]
MKQPLIGIRREDKHFTERRAPLTPEAVEALQREGLVFHIESSTSRVFDDKEYSAVGATVCDSLPACDFVVGIKEIPLGRLHPNTPHLFFSHTIKGQVYNMPMLKRMLDLKCTLIDYERVVDSRGRRLVFFGVHAGQAGMINTIWSYGQRLKALGVVTPLAELKQAKEYDSLSEAKTAIHHAAQELRRHPLSKKLLPLTCAITGTGHVAAGAQEVFDELEPVRLSPDKFLEAAKYRWLKPNEIYKVVFRIKDMVKPKDEHALFHLKDYFAHPDKYDSPFADYLPYFSMILNGTYWDARFPRLVTVEDVKRLYLNRHEPKLIAIGDVSCDPCGSIECTVRATLPDNPVYVYDPASGTAQDGFEGNGLQIMAVDILPTELPRESSQTFSSMLVRWLPKLVRADYHKPFNQVDLPAEFKTATIVYQGELTPDYRYLERYLAGLPSEAKQ